MLAIRLVLAALVLVLPGFAEGQTTPAGTEFAKRREMLAAAQRVVFLGDSITAGGGYVAGFETWLVSQRAANSPLVLNLGLASETVSGLSEDGHAGGKFPRPHLAERLDRVLEKSRPNLVFACYGMNCGIYQPLDEKRFALYQRGIRDLKAAVEKSQATLVLITPPFYDALRRPQMDYYNGVLAHYGQWLLAQRQEGWQVIDLNGPMTLAVATRRKTDPKFTFAGDGVHPNEAGHWFIAQQLIAWFGDERAAAAADEAALLQAASLPTEVLPLVRQRMALLRDAYVAAAGHKRPGVAAGLPLDQAHSRAAELTGQIKARQ